MKRIKLGGRHAVGPHQFALVDDDQFEELSRYAWKAKPNGAGNHVYAVRTEKQPDGRVSDIRMHRVVLGYTGRLDVDHINRNALDNRRSNLRVVTRSENARNRGVWRVSVTCPDCGATRAVVNKTNISAPARCHSCAAAATSSPSATPHRVACGECGRIKQSMRPALRYCSEPCKKKAQRKRQIAAGTLPPSRQPDANKARAKAWRVQGKAQGVPGPGSSTGNSDPDFSLVTRVYEGGCCRE